MHGFRFKRWFSGSRTIDATGCPLVFYRGQRRVSKPDRFVTRYKRGLASFTTVPEVASLYASTRDMILDGVSFRPGANIAPYYIRMRNPLDVRLLATNSPLWDFIECLPWDFSPEPAPFTFDWSAINDLISGFLRLQTAYSVVFGGDAADWGNLAELVDEWSEAADEEAFTALEYELRSSEIDTYAIADNPLLPEILGRLGYDGLIHKDTLEDGAEFLPAVSDRSAEDTDGIDIEDDFAFDTYRPLKQNQVKSVFNRGTFDPANPDVLA